MYLLFPSREEKVEYNIRKKAIADPSFPSEEVIAEFLEAKSMDLPSFVWLKPSLGSFVVSFQFVYENNRMLLLSSAKMTYNFMLCHCRLA